jgi:lipopolysaccharide biosynthesis glycosyltransferase
MTLDRGFVTILTGMYSFQDCIHFLAAVRKFHQEPIAILIDGVSPALYPLLKAFGNVILKQAPANQNPVLASRQAKLALYDLSPFETSLYLDCDICLLANISELFDDLNTVDLLITEDIQPDITQASNLLRVKQPILPTLQAVGLPLNIDSIQYNSGLMGFRRCEANSCLFASFRQFFELVMQHQDVLLLRDQGAVAAGIASMQPNMKVLPPTYNYLSKWKEQYGELAEPIKVLHCTYPYRPQFAKNISRSLLTRLFDRLANLLLPNQINNPWRMHKAN